MPLATIHAATIKYAVLGSGQGPWVALVPGGRRDLSGVRLLGQSLAANPSNRDRIMSLPVPAFVEATSNWRKYFLDDADKPVIGATAEQLQSIQAPTCIVPGNDRTHSHPIGDAAHRFWNARA